MGKKEDMKAKGEGGNEQQQIVKEGDPMQWHYRELPIRLLWCPSGTATNNVMQISFQCFGEEKNVITVEAFNVDF